MRPGWVPDQLNVCCLCLNLFVYWDLFYFVLFYLFFWELGCLVCGFDGKKSSSKGVVFEPLSVLCFNFCFDCVFAVCKRTHFQEKSPKVDPFSGNMIKMTHFQKILWQNNWF